MPYILKTRVFLDNAKGQKLHMAQTLKQTTFQMGGIFLCKKFSLMCSDLV